MTGVSGLPQGYELHVEDYDVDDPGLTEWNAEKRCAIAVYTEDFS